MVTEASERALYIGKFQPFHLGHKGVVMQMAEDPKVRELIIGVGSSEYHHYFGNPFTYCERAEMINRSLKINKPYQVTAIPDIHDFPKWVPHVEKLCGPFDSIFSGNTVVKKLFTDRDYRVVEAQVTTPVSASQIRNMMVERKPWHEKLPVGTWKLIDEIGGAERVRDLHDKHTRANLTADLILPYQREGYVFIERAHEPFSGMLAIAGGFLEVGLETTKQAAIREAAEEIHANLEPEKVKYLGVYDDPGRDPRGPTISHVYYYSEPYTGSIKADDDAKAFHILKPDEIPEVMAFDHRQMMRDYFERIGEKL